MGLQFVDRVEDWSEALSAALVHDAEVLVEERIRAGRSPWASWRIGRFPWWKSGPAAAPTITGASTPGARPVLLCPAPFDPAVAEGASGGRPGGLWAVGGRDYARVDVMVREDGSPVVLEVNTLPGMTETSLLPMAAAAAGLDFGGLCERMVDLARQRRGAGNGGGGGGGRPE